MDKVDIPETKEIYVVGNGYSLKDFDFNFLKDKDWIGCTLGYRHWKELGFYPKYYVNLDFVVLKNHLEEIKELVINKKCETFLFPGQLLSIWDCREYDNVRFLEEFKQQQKSPFRNLIDYCSGSTAVIFAYCMNYEVINLLGMDCNYEEFIPECIKQKDGTLKIISEPKDNPNYYFPTYQRIGDVYNVPNTERVHLQSWFDVRNIFLLFNMLRHKDIKLYNYNSSNKLDDFFERKDLKNLM
jgi:hypothetical protein